jgi:hypothetical protein
MIGESLVGQTIQRARVDVRLKFAIPNTGIELSVPTSRCLGTVETFRNVSFM